MFNNSCQCICNRVKEGKANPTCYSCNKCLYTCFIPVTLLSLNYRFSFGSSHNVWQTETHLSLRNKRLTWCHLLFYFTSYVLNMFRTLIYPSSGACDCVVELPHHSNPATPNLQHTTNREQNDQCGNSTAQSQAPGDGYINVRNMLST